MKTAFVWIVDASKDPSWWDRTAYSMHTLASAAMGEGVGDLRALVIDISGKDTEAPGRNYILRRFGYNSIIPCPRAEMEWAQDTYMAQGATDFSPSVHLRLLIPRMECLAGFDRIVSVDSDMEWRSGLSQFIKHIETEVWQPVSMVRDPYWRNWKDRLPFGKLPSQYAIGQVIGRTINPDDPYYCGALVCYHRKNMDADWFAEKVRQLLKLGFFGWNEQDILNLAVPDKDELPPEYNVFFCQDTAIRDNAHILHYAGQEMKTAYDLRVENFVRWFAEGGMVR